MGARASPAGNRSHDCTVAAAIILPSVARVVDAVGHAALKCRVEKIRMKERLVGRTTIQPRVGKVDDRIGLSVQALRGEPHNIARTVRLRSVRIEISRDDLSAALVL